MLSSQRDRVAPGSAGFTDLRVPGGYHGGAATESDGFHVFAAAAPATTDVES